MANYPSDTQLIWDYLAIAFGNDYAAAGFMGNMQAESGFYPFQLQGDLTDPNRARSHQYTREVDNGTITKYDFTHDGKGYGLCQWTIRVRKTNMYEFIVEQGDSIADLGKQLQFLMKELLGDYASTDIDYRDVYNALIAPVGNTDEEKIRYCSDIVLHGFENPADQSVSVEIKRYNLSAEIYNTFSGHTPVPPEPPVPPTPTRRRELPLYFYCIKKFKQMKGLV